MDTSISISSVAPIVYKLAKRAIDKDTNHFYGLQYTVCYGVISTKRFKAFDYEDDLFLVQKVDEGRSQWWLKNFEPETGYWDGTSNLPDGGTVSLDALFRASVFHDCGYSKAKAISEATGIPEDVLLAFFDDCFYILSKGYGAKERVAQPVYQALRAGGSLYHKIRKWLASAAVLLASSCFLCGCYSVETEMESGPPDLTWVGPIFDAVTNALHNSQTEEAQNHFLTNFFPQTDQTIVQTNEVPSTPVLEPSTTVPETKPEPQALEELKIVSFGSPDVSKAKEDPETQIEGLKMSRSGLSYRWRKGGCERFGAKDKHDHTKALAIAGSGDGKTFKCAKFDWISTDRLTRDFANIDGGYNGFSADAFWKAPKRCFFIMSADGRRRTNVLYQ